MKKFKIYQINCEANEEAHWLAYTRLERIESMGLKDKLSLSIYEEVYEGEYDFAEDEDEVNAMLEAIFVRFNRRVEGFKGHSLSVSDVVEIDGEYYFCDDFGWVKLGEEFASKS